MKKLISDLTNLLTNNFGKLSALFVGFASYSILLFGLVEVDLFDSIPLLAHFTFGLLIIFLILHLLIKPLVHIDQRRFYKSFKPGELVDVTHKAETKVMMEKFRKGMLTPHPHANESKANKFLREIGLVDHHSERTWVSYGNSVNSRGILQGNPNRYSSCIVFKVPIEMLKFPSGSLQQYFGRVHMLVDEVYPLPQDLKYYEYLGKKWIEVDYAKVREQLQNELDLEVPIINK